MLETRGIEKATRYDAVRNSAIHIVNGKRDASLPDDPHEIARILRTRRALKSPATQLREKLAADMARRLK